MAGTTPSANIGFGIPIVSSDPGPQFATDINNALIALDAHNHSPGNGLPIAAIGLNINSDLPFSLNNATSLRTVRFAATTASSGTDIGCIYVSGQDLYYNDSLGRVIQLTKGGLANGSSGNIAGLVAPASETYTPGNATFVFQSSANIAASIDVASVIVRTTVTNSSGITVSAPVGVTNWTMTLPATAGTNLFGLTTNGVGVTSWSPLVDAKDVLNLSLASNVTGGNLTVAVKDFTGADPSSASPVSISFKSVNPTSGVQVIRQITNPLSFVASTGQFLGTSGGIQTTLHIYGIDNAGTVQLGLSPYRHWDEGTLQSTSASSASSIAVYPPLAQNIYSTSALTNLAVRYLGRLSIPGNSSGGWAATAELSALTGNTGKQMWVGQATTAQSGNIGSTWFSPTGSPTATMQAARTGTYKVSCPLTMGGPNAGTEITCGVFASSGNPPILFQQQAAATVPVNGYNMFFVPYTIFNLTAGATYTFAAQAKAPSGTLNFRGDDSATGISILVEEL